MAVTYYGVRQVGPSKGTSAHDRQAWQAIQGVFETDTFTLAQGLRTIATVMGVGDIEADVTFERLLKNGSIQTAPTYRAYEYKEVKD